MVVKVGSKIRSSSGTGRAISSSLAPQVWYQRRKSLTSVAPALPNAIAILIEVRVFIDVPPVALMRMKKDGLGLAVPWLCRCYDAL